jgi:hypothetical protein
MKNRTRRFSRLFLALGVAAATFGAAMPNASACGGGWWPEVQIDHRVQGIARAEKALEGGKYADAAASVVRMIPHIRNYTKATKDPIINRAMRVLAVATVRSEGQLDFAKQMPDDLEGQWIAKKDGDKLANLEWAAHTMGAVNDWKKNDPAMQTELGEALAKVDARRGEATELLGKLAAKDLMASPEGYAALAQLRAAAGDDSGRVAALERCRAMAEDAALCKAPRLSHS